MIPSAPSKVTFPPLDILFEECLTAFRMIGGLRRCSIILFDDNQANGLLKAGFDLRDTDYPSSDIKISLNDCPQLGQCLSQRRPILLKRPFDDGLSILWKEVPDKERISAIGIIPFFKGDRCYGVACLFTEDEVDELLELRYRSWQGIGDLFSNMIASHVRNTWLLAEKTALEDILNGIGHGVVILDRNLNILRANSAMGSMVGRASSELIGTPYEMLCRESGILSEPCPVQEGINTGKVTHAVKHCQVKGSEQDRYLKVSCFPQKNAAGEVTHSIVYIRDVSVIVRAEMLQKDLTHMIVHDIRNPILAIARTLEISVTGTYGWIIRHHRDVLTAARDSCTLLLGMLDDMLDVYSYEEEGKIHLNLQPVKIHEIAEKAFKAIDTLVYEKAIQINFTLPRDLPVFTGDESRFIRVMINLLENASKFSPKNSTVLVEAMINSEGFLEVRITDTGRGIPLEHLEKIFWKFYQVDKETGIKKAGVGLGLAFCRQTIEAHGGRIWAESPASPDGLGSRFLFTIPLDQPK